MRSGRDTQASCQTPTLPLSPTLRLKSRQPGTSSAWAGLDRPSGRRGLPDGFARHVAKAPDAGVGREVVLNSLRVVLQAGFQTASRFLATGLLTLLRVPPGERVVVDTDKAVHELVRHCGPVHVESRACVRDTVLGGRRIPPGPDRLLLPRRRQPGLLRLPRARQARVGPHTQPPSGLRPGPARLPRRPGRRGGRPPRPRHRRPPVPPGPAGGRAGAAARRDRTRDVLPASFVLNAPQQAPPERAPCRRDLREVTAMRHVL